MIHDVEMPDAASEPANTTNVESTGALTIVDSIPESAPQTSANNESQFGATNEDEELTHQRVDHLAPLLATMELDNDEFAHSSFEFPKEIENEGDVAQSLLDDLQRQLEWKNKMKTRLIYRHAQAQTSLNKLRDLTPLERSQYVTKLREHKATLQEELSRISNPSKTISKV
jgi:hypothetical protein